MISLDELFDARSRYWDGVPSCPAHWPSVCNCTGNVFPAHSELWIDHVHDHVGSAA